MSRKYQILIHEANGTDFAKGTLTAVIQDARDIGVQLYANDTGSAFWTLPVTHPVLPLLKPLEQHYTVQRQNDSGVYESIAGGFVSDYDASREEVVVSGVDYMTVLDKYYTPLQGPPVGAKPINESDSNVKSAIDKDEDSDTGDTAYTIISDIASADKPYLARPVVKNSSGERNQLDVSIASSTGQITVSGTIEVVRAMSRNNKVQVGTSGFPSSGAPAISTVGIVIYSNPGGPVAHLTKTISGTNLTRIQVGAAADDLAESFSVVFDTTNGSSSGTGITGATRAVLYKGITYTFSAKAYYTGSFCRFANGKDFDAGNTGADDYWNDIDNVTGAIENPDPIVGQTSGATSVIPTTSNSFVATIWGSESRQATTTQTSGLKKQSLPTIMDELYSMGANGVLDRTSDYSDSSGTIPKSLLRWDAPSSGTSSGVTHINSGTSTFSHPYISFGQSPVELMRELADQEMGQRGTDPEQDVAKVVFNYYGVPSQSTFGEFTVNHNVSTTPVYTYVYPGTVKDYNVVNKRSILANSIRILPSSDFLIGSATDAPAGTKTKGITKSKRTLSYALPYIEAQQGFINSTAAGNYAQGILNDRGSVEDTRMVNVQLRNVNPIGATGGPRLGECVRLVVNRKAVTTGATDLVTSNYNVGGMQLLYRVDGYEQIFFDLVKPARFKGPGITFENPNAPKPKDKSSEPEGSKVGTGTDAIYRAPTQKPVYAADGRTVLPTPGSDAAKYLTGTGYMWSGTVGGRPTSTGLPKNWWKKITPGGR